MSKQGTYSVWFGSALLTITALFHFTGYFQIPVPQPSSGPPSFFDVALKPLWVFASLHWLLTAAICTLVVKAEPHIARNILLACAAVVVVDAVLLYFALGPFIGEALLAAAAFLLMMGAYKAHDGVTTAGL